MAHSVFALASSSAASDSSARRTTERIASVAQVDVSMNRTVKHLVANAHELRATVDSYSPQGAES